MAISTSTSCIALAVALLGFSATAQAQSADAPTADESTRDSSDIIVTANRREQRIIDVPATVTAVTSQDVQNLKLFRVEDIAVLSPGLAIDKGTGGFRASASLRGVTLDNNSGANPTVDFYTNEVIQNQNYAFNAMYDVGQIEVLRGPQGTLRGRPSPSGAITLTTRRPDFDEFGGYAQFTATDLNGINAQSGISIPIVPGKLAVRVAGLIDHNDGDRVRSVNNATKPYGKTASGRFSVAARPTENLELQVMYQHLQVNSKAFAQVVGAGRGYNGPSIASSDRLAVNQTAQLLSQNSDIAIWQATLDLPFNAQLIYVGGYQDELTNAVNPGDNGHSILNYDNFQNLQIGTTTLTQELRLQSTGGGMFDYVLGGYYSKADNLTFVAQPNELFGAFGVTSPISGPVNPAYILPIRLVNEGSSQSKAVFGSVTAHLLDNRLDLTAGVRYSIESNDTTSAFLASSGRVAAANIPAIPNGQGGFIFWPNACAAAGLLVSQYTNYCDFNVTLPASAVRDVNSVKPWTYNGSIRYKFSDDVNVYVSYGHSWRKGAVNTIGFEPHGNPVLLGLVVQPHETSNSYEVGLKANLFDRKLRFNVAAFQQDFKNHIIRARTAYLANTGVDDASVNFAADARVRGVELELAGNPSENWDFGLTAAYAKGKLNNASIPCRDSNKDGIPDNGPVGTSEPNYSSETGALPASFLTQAQPILFCRTNAATSGIPNFTATLQSEVRMPFGNNVAYLRGLGTYRGSATDPATQFRTNDYVILNLFAGVRIGDTADIGVYAKNVLDTDIEVDRSPVAYQSLASLPFDTGYFSTRRTAPREFGFSVRAQWGGR